VLALLIAPQWTAAPVSAARQLAGFIATYDPDVATRARATGTTLRKRLPTTTELVYGNYQFRAIGTRPPAAPYLSDYIHALQQG
jgi:hypothetical protein